MTRRRLGNDPGYWGLDRIDQVGPILDGHYRYVRNGVGVDVYLLDTGVVLDHPEIESYRIRRLHDWRSVLPPSHPWFVGPSDPRFAVDDHGHGTALASVVGGRDVGVASGVTIVSVKAFDAGGGTDASRLDVALAQIEADHGAKGGSPPSIVLIGFRHPALGDPDVRARIDSLVTAGALVIVAAGNERALFDGTPLSDLTGGIRVSSAAPGDRFGLTPPSADEVPSLAGVDGANWGSDIDVLAPGVGIRVAWFGDRQTGPDRGWRRMTGTDVAAAFVAGVAALHWEADPGATAATIRQRILEDARPSVRDVPGSTTDRLLFSRFTDSIVSLRPADPFLFEGYEGDWLQDVRLDVRVETPDGGPFDHTFAVTSGTLPPGVFMRSDGSFGGYLPAISSLDAGYVPVTSLSPEQTAYWQSRGVEGWIDWTFDVTVSSALGSDVQTYTIRVYDRDAPPQWLVEGFHDLGTIVDNDTGGLLPVDLVPLVTEPTGAPLTFSLLAGDLPPGLALSPSGQITGPPSPIPYDPDTDGAPPISRTFRFVVRASDGVRVSDLAFEIGVTRSAAFNDAPVWVTPDFSTSLGKVYIGHVVDFPLDATDSDGDGLVFSEVFPLTEPVPPAGGTVYHGIPPGLELGADGRLRGVVSETASPGQWYFQVRVTDGFTTVDRAFRLDVSVPDRTDLASLGSISWVTPAGLAGTFRETEEVWTAVVATSSTTVTYDVDPANPLPPGLTLDSATGEIRGRAPYVVSDTSWTVRVRARLAAYPTYVIERDFRIDVLETWTQPVCEVSLRVTGPDRDDLRLPWMKVDGPIRPHLFRPDDVLFGFDDTPEILVAAAFAGVSISDVWAALDLESTVYSQPPPAYGHVTALALAEPDVALARDPVTGDVVYEVLYHPVYDPSYRAGGFDDTGTPVPLPYAPDPKTGTDPLHTPPTSGQKRGIDRLYPPSIANLRRDLLDDLSPFAATERLPLWMRSEQTLGDPATIPGWIPAVVVAYLRPGTADRYLDVWRNNFSEVRATVGRTIVVGELVVRIFTDPNAPTETVIPLWRTDPRV